MAYLQANHLVGKSIFHDPYPTSVESLWHYPPFEPAGLRRELHWARAYLRPHSAQLSAFASNAQRFDSALQRGLYADAEQFLRIIEQSSGVSLWSVTNRLFLLQVSKGLDAQKKYMASIRAATGDRRLVATVAYFASVRNEPSVSSGMMRYTFQDSIGRSVLSETQYRFLKHHCVPELVSNIAHAEDILRASSGGCVIDYYEALIACSGVLLTSAPDEIANACAKTIQAVVDPSSDARAAALLNIAASESSIADMSVDMFEARLTGTPDVGKKRAFSEADLLILRAENAALEQKALNRNAKALRDRLEAHATAVLIREPSDAGDVSELDKFVMNQPSSRLMPFIEGFLARESSASHSDIMGNVRRAAAAYAPKGSVYKVLELESSSLAQKVMSDFRDVHGERLATRLLGALHNYPEPSDELGDVVRSEFELLAAEIALQHGRATLALDVSERYLTANRFEFIRAVRIRANGLVQASRLPEAIQFVVEKYLGDRSLFPLLPIATIVREMTDEVRRECKDLMALPILLNLYSAGFDHDYDDYRNYAYEDFLFGHNCRVPSELVALCEDVPPNQLIYFLREVCTESVLETSEVFDGSKQVSEERLAICRLLAKLDPENARAYDAEATDLLRRLMVRRRMRDIEQSKIFVDAIGLRRVLSEVLGESVTRYRALDEAGVDFDSRSVAVDLQEFEKDAAGTDLSPAAVALPTNERRELLISILSRITREYTLNPQFGLDTYLSVRIRHGTLLAQLRSHVANANLVTQRSRETSGEYRRNEYWIRKLAGNDADLGDRIAAKMARFSKEFDDLTDMIVKQWVQIYRGEGSKGLVHLTIPVDPIEELLRGSLSVDRLLDVTFTSLAISLENSLANIRYRLESEAKPRAIELLNKLVADIQAVAPDSDHEDLAAAVGTVKTEISRAFDRIIGWFYVSKGASNEPFSPIDSIRLAEETVRLQERKFQVNYTEDDSVSLRLEGALLAPLYDIFLNLFENIVKHGDPVKPIALVHFVSFREGAVIRVANQLPEGDKAKRNERAAAIREHLRSSMERSVASREGGSGLIKVSTLLERIAGQLEFGISGEEFVVEFSIPVTLV